MRLGAASTVSATFRQQMRLVKTGWRRLGDWSKLDGGDWINLIAACPEFIDRCDWSKFNAHDIVRIVRQCGKIGVPMAALHLDECDFTQLTASDWSQVLALRPDLVDKFESIERDWSKDNESDDIEEILQDSP